MRHLHMIGLALAACLSACSSDPTPSSTSTQSPTSPAGGDAGGAAPSKSKLVTVRANIRYAGTKTGPLSVGLFTENPPKTRPPVAFDTSTKSLFPFAAELRDVEPGTYWVVAVLDLPPVSVGSVVPGREDLQVTSEPITVTSDDVQLDVTLKD